MQRLAQIGVVFGAASLLSFGGGNAIIPQLELAAVHDYGWLTAREFADSFAIAQVMPGPSTLLVTILGYRAGGLLGALVATVAMVLPAAVLVWAVARVWLRTGRNRWHMALEHGLAPVGVGLVAAGGLVVARSVDSTAAGLMITVSSTLLLITVRLHPLVVVAAGGAAGLLLGGV